MDITVKTISGIGHIKPLTWEYMSISLITPKVKTQINIIFGVRKLENDAE